MSNNPFKDFSLDITRTILEDVSRSCPKTAHALVLSCHTIRQWIEPIIYSDVSIPNLGSMWAFKSSIEARNDPAFFARSVHTLTICAGDEFATNSVLEVCTDITTLRILIPRKRDKLRPKNMSTFEIPDLRHLTSLTSLTLTDGLEIDTNRLPPHVTHVRMIWNTGHTSYDGTPRSQIMAMLRECPITHLMCNLVETLENEDLPTFILHALKDKFCPHLRVFVLLGTTGRCYFSGVETRWRRPPPGHSPFGFDIISEIGRKMDPRVVVVNPDKEYFGQRDNVLDMDFEEDQMWEKAEEYLRNIEIPRECND